MWAYTHAHSCTCLQRGLKFDRKSLENSIYIWGNGDLQGKDLLRQPNAFRNQAWCAADFFFPVVNLILFLFVEQINNFWKNKSGTWNLRGVIPQLRDLWLRSPIDFDNKRKLFSGLLPKASLASSNDKPELQCHGAKFLPLRMAVACVGAVAVSPGVSPISSELRDILTWKTVQKRDCLCFFSKFLAAFLSAHVCSPSLCSTN